MLYTIRKHLKQFDLKLLKLNVHTKNRLLFLSVKTLRDIIVILSKNLHKYSRSTIILSNNKHLKYQIDKNECRVQIQFWFCVNW